MSSPVVTLARLSALSALSAVSAVFGAAPAHAAAPAASATAPAAASATAPAAASAAAPATAPPCTPRDLRMTLDGRDGDFNGMSHAGTALVLLNMRHACRLPGVLAIEFHDARGMKLPVQTRDAPGSRPAAMRLDRGQRAQMTLRWVAGPVYAHSRSGQAVDVGIKLGGAGLRASLHADLYGEAGRPIYVERSALHAVEAGTGKR